MENDTNFRLLVYGMEIILALGLIGWMRGSLRGAREKWSFILKILAGGALAAVLSAVVTLKYSFNIPELTKTHPSLVNEYGIWLKVINHLAGSMIEELGKYMIGVFTLLSTRHVHKMSDTIVYLIVIGLGFSLIEDAFFLLDPQSSPLLRLMSFYLHSGTSAIIGYSLGRYKFGLASYRELLLAVFAAIILHFGFNLTSELYGNPALYVAFGISTFITLQIFILFRRTLVEEYGLELRAKRLRYTKIVTGKTEVKAC
ncbi:MAG TPA: PrsW family glutamic-type intramembrane protease [Verrucomicrobiae bacterium]|nr:PrsW family glutamic-type intramembrane protease [Verrucomicrobiae bacterium]